MSEIDKLDILAAMHYSMAEVERLHLCGTSEAYWANKRADEYEQRARYYEEQADILSRGY